MKNLRYTTIICSFTCAIALLASEGSAQSPVHDRASSVLQAIDQAHIWDNSIELREEYPGVFILESKSLTFTFYGSNHKFSSFRWTEKIDAVRVRGKVDGTFFRGTQSPEAKARAVLRAVSDLDPSWKFRRLINDHDEEFGQQVEFQSGLVGVEFEREVYGLRALGYSAFVLLDTVDGAVVSISISGPDFEFEEPIDTMTAEEAIPIAKRIAEVYLKDRIGDANYIEQISRLKYYDTPNVLLAYNGVDAGFNSNPDRYLERRIWPPAYIVDFGGMTIQIHAVTGESLGGGIAGGVPMSDDGNEIRESANTKDEETAGSAVVKENSEESSESNSTGAVIWLVAVGAACIGATIAWLVAKRTAP